jgi:PleD family two-component response regulator
MGLLLEFLVLKLVQPYETTEEVPMAKKILIIDELTNRLTPDLEANNYQVWRSGNAREGLARALELKPQLILMNLNLAGLNGFGFELCKKMRSFPELRHIPIIIFSGENKLKNMVTAYEMGADYYIVKGEEDDRVLTLLIETIFTRLSRQHSFDTQVKQHYV